LIKTRDGYRLLSRVCPHQGGTVEDDGGQFVCHNHGYQYDKAGNASRSGQTVQQIADAQGKHVVDALLDMVVEDDLAPSFSPRPRGGRLLNSRPRC
jgi:Rieske Fe-S protein